MDIKTSKSFIIFNLILFLRNTWGTLQTPYITYRILAKGEHLYQAFPLYVLCVAYFGWASLAHFGISAHPFFLTISFGRLITGASITFILVLLSIWLIGLLFGGKGSLKTIILPWSYALLPTLTWFWCTSFLSIVFPPPRTTSFQGMSLSFIFISFSVFLFLWKTVLYYLTLRHGMHLGFWKIVGATMILIPLGILYALFMYSFGIFRVPFI